jgi:hypothetical protein
MKIKIISKTLEATFGLKLDSIHECCECPEEHKAQLKDSVWVYIKDQMTLSVLLIMEIGLIPFHQVNQAYERAKKKMDTE